MIFLILALLLLVGCSPKPDGELILGNWYAKGIAGSKMMTFHENGTMLYQQSGGPSRIYEYKLMDSSGLLRLFGDRLIQQEYEFADENTLVYGNATYVRARIEGTKIYKIE